MAQPSRDALLCAAAPDACGFTDLAAANLSAALAGLILYKLFSRVHLPKGRFEMPARASRRIQEVQAQRASPTARTALSPWT